MLLGARVNEDSLTKWVIGVVAAALASIPVILVRLVFKGVVDKLEAILAEVREMRADHDARLRNLETRLAVLEDRERRTTSHGG